MKIRHGTSSDRKPCVVCGKKSHTHVGIKQGGIVLDLYACDGEHYNYVKRQYAQSLLTLVLTLIKKIATGV